MAIGTRDVKVRMMGELEMDICKGFHAHGKIGDKWI